MPKRARLRGTDLRRIKGARRIHGALFSLALSPLETGSRATITVSKKVSPKAVLRNLIKRRARAALAPLMKTLPRGAYVFSAKSAASDATHREIEADIRRLAQQSR